MGTQSYPQTKPPEPVCMFPYLAEVIKLEISQHPESVG